MKAVARCSIRSPAGLFTFGTSSTDCNYGHASRACEKPRRTLDRTPRNGFHESSGFPQTPGLLMKEHAPMTQTNIVLLFLYGFVGIMLWIIGVIALDIF